MRQDLAIPTHPELERVARSMGHIVLSTVYLYQNAFPAVQVDAGAYDAHNASAASAHQEENAGADTKMHRVLSRDLVHKLCQFPLRSAVTATSAS
jgi:hypothetical protein